MSNEMFVLVLAVGAAALAGWIHARFPGLAPERMGKTALHTGIAFVLLKLTPGFGESPMWIFAGVFLFVLPRSSTRCCARSGAQFRPDGTRRLTLEDLRGFGETSVGGGATGVSPNPPRRS